MRKCEVRTFCDIPFSDFFNSPKRFVPVSKSRTIRTFHLSPININVVSTGQGGNFSFNDITNNSFKFNNSILMDTMLHSGTYFTIDTLNINLKTFTKQKTFLFIRQY